MKGIKDPIHGYIDLYPFEEKIVNEPEFQRLRRIKQLGFSSVVYPSATHTRFEHSLGVMYLSGELASSLSGLKKDEIEEIRLAGLLHDLGHLPYSHTLEPLLERRKGISHVDISCEYIDKIQTKNDIEFPVPPSNIKDRIRGNSPDINIISNEIDVDRQDYLIRDSKNTGIKLGEIETETLLRNSEIIDGELGFNYKALNAVESMLDARLRMNKSVYSHDTVNITESMLRKAVYYYLENTDSDILDLIGMDDHMFSQILLNTSIEETKELFERIQVRDLYKSAILLPLRERSEEEIIYLNNQLTPSYEHEKEIAEMADVSSHEVIICQPQSPSSNEFKTPIKTVNDEVYSLEDISEKPRSLRQTKFKFSRLNVACPKENIDNVKKSAESYFDTEFGI